MQVSETEILICGAGPAGLMMACQLARYQVQFRIIDSQIRKVPYSGALIIHPASLEILQKSGIDNNFIVQGQEIRSLHFVFNRKKHIRLNITETGKNISSFPCPVLIEQCKTEQILTGFLKSMHHEVEHAVQLKSFISHPGFIECFVTKENSLEEKIIAQYLIGADGSHSFVRQFINVPFKGKTHKRSLFISDCKTASVHPENEMLFLFSKDVSAGIFRLDHNRLRIDGAFMHGENINNSLGLEQLRAVDRELKAIDWYSEFKSRKLTASSSGVNRCFLVGDAAHVFSPVGAQGMNNGFYDAFNLAWKISYVLKGYTTPDILKSYSFEREKPVRKTAEITDFLFRLLSSEQFLLAFIRLRVLPPALQLLKLLMKSDLIRKLIFFGYSGIGKSRKYLANVPYIQGGEIRHMHDNLSPDGFTLFVLNESRYASSIKSCIRNYLHLIKIVDVDSQDITLNKLNHLSNGFMLIRPDFRIACRGNKPRLLEEYLEKTFIEKYDQL